MSRGVDRVFRCSIAGVLAVLSFAVFAADAPRWQVVMQDGPERIALDNTRISRGFGGTRAWSRIDLGREVADPAGAYNAIEAENRYACGEGKFSTLRRVYFKDSTPVREEAAWRERSNSIVVGSIDERLFNAACRERRETTQLAHDDQRAGRVMQLANSSEQMSGERAQAMPADVRSVTLDSGVHIVRVADEHGGGDKPRLIELPKIDKEAAAREAAAAGVSLTPAAPAKPADIKSTAAAASAAAAPTVAAPTVATPRSAAPASRALPPGYAATPDLGVSGHARELLLATSGPRKKAPKKEPPKESENPAYDMHVHWGYDGAGAPDKWGKLRPEYATCDNGKRQSPIDIRPGIAVDLEAIKFDWKPTRFTVIDNGHTIQVNVGAGNTINVMNKRFELVQFHFHKPSEERVNGRPYPMVIHFVHKDWDDNLAVIAVLLDEGPEHPLLQVVWNNLPLERDSEVVASDVLDLVKLLPENRAYWTYMGSLTTPPCSENVLWMVMKSPLPVSPEQIGIFGRLYRNNARPPQPANGRLVKESR